MGDRQGVPNQFEMDQMTETLSDCLSQGACGLSTGLMYAPGSSAQQDELVKLCKVVARHGKVYATHMRSYSDQLLESIEEQIALARESGCRLQISHLQAVGARNWDKQDHAIELLEQARQEGIDVEFDSYPYLAGSTVLTQLLPQGAIEGGIPALVELLARPDQRKAVADATVKKLAQRWSDIFIASVGSQRNQGLVGLNFDDLGLQRGVAPIDAALDLLIEEQGVVNILSFNQSEENLRKLLTHPLCTVISDGFYVKGRPHPRLYGTFPCLLGEIVRQRGWLSLAEAVHKITDKPAQRFGLKSRGRIAAGFVADLVVFDPVRVAGRATYQEPKLSPQGISLVLREGHPVAGLN
jgi:N-acyl-D-amino-acid deacylase